MKLLSALAVAAVIVTSQYASATENPNIPTLKRRRTNSLLISPPQQPPLPSAQQAASAASSVGLNLTDIQGDILIGMKKDKELFFFFSITDAAAFKSKLGTDILELITSTDQLLSNNTQPVTAAVNVAFSSTGLQTLGIKDKLNDTVFDKGMLSNAVSDLSDPGTGNWVPGFVGTSVHGVFLLASDTIDNVNTELANIQTILNGSITEVHRLQGAARPGDQQGHEHFGFMDGISNPAIDGFTSAEDRKPGQVSIPPGILLLGEKNDTLTRPPWAKDGSFLVFRQMQQRVPEFNKFLQDHALNMPNMTSEQGADLLGARIVGRWKSGAPVDLTPLVDDPTLSDSDHNNNFTFAHPGASNTDQTRCPFSAHIRKTNPRSDLPEQAIDIRRIIRAGIPYGPEVTEDEHASNSSSTDPSLERGLAFVAYQSNIANGFVFLQKTWVDNAAFLKSGTGVDPLIGTNSRNSGTDLPNTPRVVSGLDPNNASSTIEIDIDFVVSRGGEYFFSPSLSAIKTVLSV